LIEVGVEGTRPVMGGRRRTSHINTTEPLVMELQMRGPGFECESGETTRSGAVVDGRTSKLALEEWSHLELGGNRFATLVPLYAFASNIVS
jgi:hypothetical protein